MRQGSPCAKADYEQPQQIHQIPGTVAPRPQKNHRGGEQQNRQRDDQCQTFPGTAGSLVIHGGAVGYQTMLRNVTCISELEYFV